MITLFHCMSARSFRPLWMLEELKLPYALIMLPFPPRVKDKAFLAINPTGTVPLCIDGPTSMTESSAICHYLAARYGPATINVDIHDSEFGNYLNYLSFGEATLTFPQTLVLRYTRFEQGDRRSQQVADDYAKWFLARLRTLEPILAQRDYVCADRFTAADVSVGYSLLLAQHLNLTSRITPAVLAYWARLQQREAYLRAMSAQTAAAIAQGISLVPAPDTKPDVSIG